MNRFKYLRRQAPRATGPADVLPLPRRQGVFAFAAPDPRKCVSDAVFRRMLLLSHMVWHVPDKVAWRLSMLEPHHHLVRFFAQASRETIRHVGGFSVCGRWARLGPSTIGHIIHSLNRLGLHEEMSSDELFSWQRGSGAANDTKENL